MKVTFQLPQTILLLPTSDVGRTALLERWAHIFWSQNFNVTCPTLYFVKSVVFNWLYTAYVRESPPSKTAVYKVLGTSIFGYTWNVWWFSVPTVTFTHQPTTTFSRSTLACEKSWPRNRSRSYSNEVPLNTGKHTKGWFNHVQSILMGDLW